MKINYGIIAVNSGTAVESINSMDDVLHFVGYEHRPTQQDATLLYEELISDVQFQLIDVKFDIIPAPNHIVELVREMFEGVESDE